MTKRPRVPTRALLLVAIAASLCLASTRASGAEERRVVVMTTDGDRIEGVLRGATEQKLTVEVAGQPVVLPVDSVRSITFKTTAAEPVPAINDLASVQESLRGFHAALQLGMLRSEYAAKLDQVLPPIADFLRTRKPYWHPDAQLALAAAMAAYKNPLASIYGWSSATDDWQRASAYLRYAEDVARADPSSYREDPKEKPLTPGNEVRGRIGFGDAPGPEFLGSQTLADVYRVEVARAGRMLISAAGSPCSLYEEVCDSAGKDVSTMRVTGGWAAKVGPGTYRLVVFCGDGGVGTYKMRTELVP